MNNEINPQAVQFESTILPHLPSLYGPAMALTRSTSDAEDLIQETLLRAFTHFDSFRSDGSPRAWLHTIMRNLFINTYRKKNRGPREVSFEQLDEPGVYASTSVSGEGAARPSVASPERAVLSQMEGAAVRRAVAALPDDYRRVVELADMQGLSYQEIAEDLHIPVGTVRSRLNRGRKRVQRALYAWRSSESATPMSSPQIRSLHPAVPA